MAYIGTYYAIGATWILTLANYFLIGWYNGYLDHYYLGPFKVYFSLIIAFSALGNIALAVLRYRLSEKSLLGASRCLSQSYPHHQLTIPSFRKLQMALPLYRLSRRNLHPRVPTPPLPLLRNQHVLERYHQRSRKHTFLRRTPSSHQAFQIHIHILYWLHGSYDCGRHGVPVELAH